MPIGQAISFRELLDDARQRDAQAVKAAARRR
jgi:hypothetical protein